MIVCEPPLCQARPGSIEKTKHEGVATRTIYNQGMIIVEITGPGERAGYE